MAQEGPDHTYPPRLLHVTTWQPLHKINASQWSARWGQEDRSIHHEIFHIHGLYLGETDIAGSLREGLTCRPGLD